LRQKPIFYFDRWLLVGVLPLLGSGLLMVASASMVISDRQYGTPFHYLFRQAIYLGMSLVLAVLILQIPVEKWRRWSGHFLLLCFGLLILVLVPHIGVEFNGGRRWIRLGFLTFQIAELAKFCAITYMASYLMRHNEEVRTQLSGFIKPLVLL